ncbi:MAG: hypothetical protein ABI847_15345, partial [Anaerolineales bacterium]
MAINRTTAWRGLALFMAASLVLAACAPRSAGATQPVTSIVTDTGFVCPAANPPATLTSKELNLFVWTEYIPQDMIDCF